MFEPGTVEIINVIGVIIGIGAGVIGMLYFVIQKILDNKDKAKEFKIFKDDLIAEITSLAETSTDKYLNKWDEKTNERSGHLGNFNLDTFELFNTKYRHHFDKKTRHLLGALNILIRVFNENVRELSSIENDIVFKNKPRTREMKAEVIRYNTDLVRISESSKEIKELLEDKSS